MTTDREWFRDHDRLLDRLRETSSPQGQGRGTETRRPEQVPHTLPKSIGRFHVKRLIASGGMGTIYEAIQDHPRRSVAVKVMKHGIASRSAMRRFEYESQVLARLRHPGIAQIYEAGTHTDPEAPGAPVPFFAMEYIPSAKPITQYAAEKKLSTRQRLELFAQVCEAAHHGHQKGVIHRDLKPSNILVDPEGHPKIIDFGVARGTDSDMAVTTLQTSIGQLIGTLQYMSPEQCEADPSDLDIRSDVYALGVVLYELLSEKLPYDVSNKPVLECTRVIREQQPTRLSTVSAALKGDTETIVLKALEKDRERRYQSATELARDIRRYLAGEAIAARPPSMAYQFRVFARRNKAACAAVVIVFAVLVAASIVSTSLYLQADAARADAVAAQTAEAEQRKLAEANEQLARQREQEAVVARDAEAEQREMAEASAARAEQVATLIKDMLGSVGPGVAKGRDTALLREILDRTAERLDEELEGQPEVQAELRQTVGWTYFQLGLHERAEALLRGALAHYQSGDSDDDARAAEIMRQLGDNLGSMARSDESESLYRQALAIERRFGNEHGSLAESLFLLAQAVSVQGRPAEAERLISEAITIASRLYGNDDPMVLHYNFTLGVTLHSQGQLAVAESVLRTTLMKQRQLSAPEHLDLELSDTIRSLAALLRDKGELDEAEQLYREALGISRQMLGPEHPDLEGHVRPLARVLQDKSDLAGAEALWIEHLEFCRSKVSEDHPNVAMAVRHFASFYSGSSRFDRQDAVWKEHLEKCREELDEDDPAVAAAVHGLGTSYFQTARYALAEPLLHEAVDKRKRVLGEKNTETLTSLETLVLTLNAQGKTDEARRFGAELIELRRRRTESPDAKADDHNSCAWLLLTIEPSDLRDAEAALPIAERAVELSQRKNASMLDTLAVAYEMSGDFDKAVETQREALALLPMTWSTTRAEFQESLGRFLNKKGQPAAAEQVWRNSVDWLRDNTPGDQSGLANALIYLGRSLNAHDKFAEAEPILRKCLELRRKVLSPGHWLIANAMSSLGECLAGQGKFAEAEPLLLDAYDQLQNKALTINYRARPDRLREGLERIVNLYEAWGAAEPDPDARWDYTEKAAEWRAQTTGFEPPEPP